MPIEFLGTVFIEGTHRIPYWDAIKKYTPPLFAALTLKLYFNGSSNTWERKLHGKVYIVTGGTSGVGSALVRELAQRGAQLVLLTSQISENADNSAKTWVTDYVEDLREATNNQLIYTEDCDLSSLYSIRKFATKWLDNSPARRLDGVICLAADSLPIGKLRQTTLDDVEKQIGVNYLGHYHLLTLLEPALRVQPPDRDVRVLVASCMSQTMAELDFSDLLWETRRYPANKPWKVFGTSKLMLNMFAKEFQRRVESVERPDKQPCGIRVNTVNPGFVRSPSMRRTISMGSILGLFLYLIFYPIFWIFLKSCEQGMQSFLYAINSPNLFTLNGGNYIKECTILKNEGPKELKDEVAQKKLFDETKKIIEDLEKRSAIERSNKKKNTKGKKVNDLEEEPVERKENVVANAKLSIFRSAFGGDGGLYPDMNKINKMSGEDDKAKQDRLKRLDKKFERSRSKKI